MSDGAAYKIETECHCRPNDPYSCQLHHKDPEMRANAWRYKYEREHEGRKCPIPGCPADRRREVPPPGCMCGKPLWIVIPPGGHIHPCPVHPDRVVYGPSYTLGDYA